MRSRVVRECFEQRMQEMERGGISCRQVFESECCEESVSDPVEMRVWTTGHVPKRKRDHVVQRGVVIESMPWSREVFETSRSTSRSTAFKIVC
jgi:hypothetical protein